MKFEDINTNELRELGILPIPYFKQLKLWVSVGYADKFYWDKGYGIYPKFDSYHKEIKHKPQWINDIIDKERITINSFEEIKEEEFEWLGFKGKALAKLLWLQRYLKGEENAPYIGEKDGIYQNILFKKTLEEKDEQIRKLKEQIETLRTKNDELAKQNKSLETSIKETEKVHKKFEKLKLEFMEIFENI